MWEIKKDFWVYVGLGTFWHVWKVYNRNHHFQSLFIFHFHKWFFQVFLQVMKALVHLQAIMNNCLRNRD
jgi:hypothetical protein